MDDQPGNSNPIPWITGSAAFLILIIILLLIATGGGQ